MRLFPFPDKRRVQLSLLMALLLVLGAYVWFSAVSGDARVMAKVGSGGLVHLPFVSNGPEVGVFYISPQGNDTNAGRSPGEAWATFNRAWQELYPGDTLLLMDGIYHQTLAPNVRDGEPGLPIIIKAQNDGQAIVEGDNQRIPVSLRHEANGWHIGNWFVIEGIVARNSSGSVYLIQGNYNYLRRVSGYNANTDGNDHVYVLTGDNNLVEDCVAAGTGRKMIMAFMSENNIIRRCLADWQQWDGREWHDCWPWGDGIELYNSSYNIIENSISYSRNPTQAINVLAQGGVHSIGNKVLGSIAIMVGMHEDGTPMDWGDTRPQPTEYTCVRNFNWPGQRSGFNVYESGSMVRDNLWQDILSWGNAGLGLSWIRGVTSPDTGNNSINRATVLNNGLDNPVVWGGIGIDALQADLDRFGNVTNSYIETIYTGSTNTSMNGEGARLTYRYVDGLMTNIPLWPWPMEDRIQAELGYSVTDLMNGILSQLP
jgi:hypothetical protein